MGMIPIQIRLELELLWDDTEPEIAISLDAKSIFRGHCKRLTEEFEIQQDLAAGQHELVIDFRNKQYQIRPPGTDMAVIIRKVYFQHTNNDFSGFGIYRPVYPEPWYTEQVNLGTKPPSSLNGRYLGWNGTWSLQFSTPIYRWMHQQLDLGWLI